MSRARDLADSASVVDPLDGLYGSSSSPIIITVKVATKTASHPYNGDGSSSGYTLNNVESPAIKFGGTDAATSSTEYVYRFDQADSSNSGHPLRFYLDAAKATAFTTGVTTNGTAGSAGAYTQIAVDSETPKILYYQCSSHAYMGNYATVSGSLSFSAGSLRIAGTTVTSTGAELNILDGVTCTAAELNILDGVTSTAAELNILDGVTSTAAELNILDGVTSTASELNILDGVTSSTAELNILDGVTATATEINKLDAVSRGSLIYGNASAETALLTKGSANQVLTSDGTDIAWANAAAGGTSGMQILSTVTASNSATVDLETTLDSTYDYYIILCSDIVPVTDNANMIMRYKIGSYLNSNYEGNLIYTYDGTGNHPTNENGFASGLLCLRSCGNASDEVGMFQANIANVHDTGRITPMYGFGAMKNSYDGYQGGWAQGANTATGAVTGIRFLMDSGNISSGVFRLYGVAKS